MKIFSSTKLFQAFQTAFFNLLTRLICIEFLDQNSLERKAPGCCWKQRMRETRGEKSTRMLLEATNERDATRLSLLGYLEV